jgi:hypothetical protein
MTVNHEIRLGQPSSGSTLGDGLVHLYKMDETTGQRQDTIGTAHLSLLAGSYYVTGKDGNAFDSNAGASGLYVAGSSVHPGTNFTYSMWVSRQGTDNLAAISIMDDNSGWRIDIEESGIAFVWGLTSSAVDMLTVGTGWNLIQWWGSTSSIGLKVDDRTAVTDSKSGTSIPSLNLQIGYNEYMDEGFGNSWDGWFDDLNVYNRVLTADELLERYNGGAGKFYPYT